MNEFVTKDYTMPCQRCGKNVKYIFTLYHCGINQPPIYICHTCFGCKPGASSMKSCDKCIPPSIRWYNQKTYGPCCDQDGCWEHDMSRPRFDEQKDNVNSDFFD